MVKKNKTKREKMMMSDKEMKSMMAKKKMMKRKELNTAAEKMLG